jgi:hypothetical protein
MALEQIFARLVKQVEGMALPWYSRAQVIPASG